MKNVYRDGERSPNLALKPYLREGEQVLWTGTPYEKERVRLPLAGMIFILFWLGFAVAWTVSAFSMSGGFGFFGIPFLLFGAGMLWYFTVGMTRRGKYMLYAVTDTRALILSETKGGMNLEEYVFSALRGVILRSVRNGSGTIEFVLPEVMYLRAMGYRNMGNHRLCPGSFEMIADVERVYRLISDRVSEGKGPDIPV